MTWIQQIQNLPKKLLKIGITEELSFSEKLRIELSNQFILFAFPAAIFHLVYNFLTINTLRGYVLVTLWFCIMGTTLMLNHHKKHLAARLFILIISSLVIATTHLLFGWVQRLDFMYLLFILISCYILERKPAVSVITFILLIYTGVSLYISNFGPISPSRIIGSGTFAYFAFAVVITISLTSKMLRENYRYNQITIEQNKILEAQNQELERFTYIASHDLKSPLSNIMGFSDIIEEDLKEENYELALQHLSYIQTSSKRMSYLIEDILELSKIRNENEENRSWVNLNKIMKTIQHTMTQELQQKQAQIFYQNLPKYYCNETEFSLLFQNIIQNGLKYNDNPIPEINIWASQSNDSILLHFKDNGIGIAPQHYEQIFEYFKRLHNQTEYEGTGIGLGLCKKIVLNYGGRITVQSVLKKGSTFTIALPLLQ
ncbi:MAG: ATP-binding protein [Chitinophagales bacterium]